MKIKLLSIFLMTTVMFNLGCKKYVEGINDNPNNPADAPGELMITGAEVANVLVQGGEMARLACMWSGQFTGADRQYIALNTYSATAGDFDSPWGNTYANVVAQCQIIQDKADESNDPALKGVAQILEANAMGTLTSLWGDVPYSEANNKEQYPNPKYDSQAEVYENIQTLLDDAITNVEGAGGAYANATYVNSWSEIANTLKARYYLHTGDYESALAAAANGISIPDNNWESNHEVSGFTDGKFNLLFSFTIWYRDGYMTADGAHLVDLLSGRYNEDNYRGNDKTDETARFNYYYLDGGFYGAVDPHYWAGGIFWRDQPYTLVSYEENQLIKAECESRLGNNEGALTALNEVRTTLNAQYQADSVMVYAPYEMSDFEGGIVDHSLLQEILEEKYVCLYGQIEVFNDLKRTNNMIGVPATEGDELPKRFVYPQSEINANENIVSPLPDLFDPTPINQ